MIRVNDNRAKQLKDKLPLQIHLTKSMCFISDNGNTPSPGLSIEDVNGHSVPYDVAVTSGQREIVGFLTTSDATWTDFDFVVIKKPSKPDF
jgi:hypothetical protein